MRETFMVSAATLREAMVYPQQKMTEVQQATGETAFALA